MTDYRLEYLAYLQLAILKQSSFTHINISLLYSFTFNHIFHFNLVIFAFINLNIMIINLGLTVSVTASLHNVIIILTLYFKSKFELI